MKRSLFFRISIYTIILLFLAAEVFLIPNTVEASCAEPGSPETEFRDADAVFTGSVVYISSANGIWKDDITRVLLSLGINPGDMYEKIHYGRKIVFEVDRAWKGVETSSITIHTGYSTGDSSGYPFELGGYYLVYASHAYGDPEQYLLTSLCHRTLRSPNNSEDVAYLNNLPTLELSYFPAIIRTINGSFIFTTLLFIGFGYILFRRRKHR